MKNLLKGYLLLVIITGIIIVSDRLTKDYVRSHLAPGDIWSPWPWLTPYARIVHWYNTGSAFGMFQGLGNIFSVLAIIVALAIIYYFPRVPASDWMLRLAMSLQLGGALGNMIDRVTFGHVTDFVSIGTFPVFNVADSSITVGVIILILGVWLQERQQKKESDELERQAAQKDAETPLDELNSQNHKASG